MYCHILLLAVTRGISPKCSSGWRQRGGKTCEAVRAGENLYLLCQRFAASESMKDTLKKATFTAVESLSK
jgi:hypothetical protein